MEKVVRDGKVAVLYSPGFGAGWYTWHNIAQLVFDPVIVNILEDSGISKAKQQDDIVSYVDKQYAEEQPYTGGVENLCIEWLPEGTKFHVQEYDGAESLLTLTIGDWLVA